MKTDPEDNEDRSCPPWRPCYAARRTGESPCGHWTAVSLHLRHFVGLHRSVRVLEHQHVRVEVGLLRGADREFNDLAGIDQLLVAIHAVRGDLAFGVVPNLLDRQERNRALRSVLDLHLGLDLALDASSLALDEIDR